MPAAEQSRRGMCGRSTGVGKVVLRQVTCNVADFPLNHRATVRNFGDAEPGELRDC